MSCESICEIIVNITYATVKYSDGEELVNMRRKREINGPVSETVM
jgi:hypothetical protein